MSPADEILYRTEADLVNAVVGRAAGTLNKHTYGASLQAYAEELGGILEPVQQCCSEHPELQQEWADKLAQTLLSAILKDLQPLSRGERAMRQDAYLMFVVTLLSPALLKLEQPMGQSLCQALQQTWKTVWPKQEYQIATEEMIAAGYDKKWYKCYITQATCQSLGKPDDCFELNAFRTFRDGYLSSCADGPALIQAYYQSAPAIVRRISLRLDRDRIYQDIWEKYLQPCLSDLLHSRWEDCKKRYTDMVRVLQREFLPNGTVPPWDA